MPPGVRRLAPPPAARPAAEPAAVASAPRRRHRALKWALVVLAVLVVAAGGVAATLRFAVYDHVVPNLRGLDVTAAAAATHRNGLKLAVDQAVYSFTVPERAVVSQTLPAGSRERSGTTVHVVVSKGVQPVQLPKLSGLTRKQAAERLTAAHLTPELSSAFSETVAAGTVIGWSPTGPSLPWGSKVAVVVSQGPKPRIIPSNLVGQQVDAVAGTLTQMGLVVERDAVYSTTFGAGEVTQTTPAAGAQIARGKTVIVYYSLGPPFVTVPSLYGVSVKTAETELQARGLTYQVFGPSSGAIVYTTDPQPGTKLRVGQTVVIYTI